MHLSRRVLTAAGAAIIVLGGGTAALARTGSQVGTSGVIHGCYTTAGTNGSHSIVLQTGSSSCPHGTTALKWNVRGRTGPSGPTGTRGPSGPAGPSTAGPSGLDVITIQGTTTAFGPNFYGIACPPSHPYLLGGSPTPGGSEAQYQGVEPMPVGQSAPAGSTTLSFEGGDSALFWLTPGMPVTIFYSPASSTGQQDAVASASPGTNQLTLQTPLDASATAGETEITAQVWFGNYAFCSH